MVTTVNNPNTLGDHTPKQNSQCRGKGTG